MEYWLVHCPVISFPNPVQISLLVNTEMAMIGSEFETDLAEVARRTMHTAGKGILG